jgi:hypothetical protein
MKSFPMLGIIPILYYYKTSTSRTLNRETILTSLGQMWAELVELEIKKSNTSEFYQEIMK